MRGDAPVFAAEPDRAQTIASSGTSQQTTAAAGNGGIVDIAAFGGNVWVKIGANPTAVADSGWVIGDGQSKQFDIEPGHKVAVIDAAF